ncbi:MAG: lipid-A-disaccharide synthase [Candidatus Omnitrophota bacterium]|nr:lipid-A-disaccharide synthase [Candidatus Omnitrophota bacterium]MBU1894203.1 lipid-A-disaccharide synthase [Candidatus Omnitrophota bacterium]
MKHNILIIAGEPSGDIRAGELLKEFKKLIPYAIFWGIGGDSMKKEGVHLVEHIKNLSMVGVWEVIKNLSKIRLQYNSLTSAIKKKKPSLAILVDYPGFNLRIAKFLKKQQIPVIYYVIPQVWAWGTSRVKQLREYVDKSLVLFDFEKSFLSKHHVDCEFVGHPLVDSAKNALSQFPETRSSKNTIALLPGSRKHEISTLFPIMLSAAEQIKLKMKAVKFVVAESSNIDRSIYASFLSKHPSLNVSRVLDDTFAALSQSDFAIVTSGTATLETALMEKPMIIIYKAAFITCLVYHIVRKIPFLGLVNIIVGKEIVPEMLQKNANAEKISLKTLEILSSPSRMLSIKNDLKKVKSALGEEGSSRRAAHAINRFIEENHIFTQKP